MNKRNLTLLGLFGLSTLVRGFNHVDLPEWNYPLNPLGMVPYWYAFTTSHTASGGGHWVFLRMQKQGPDGNWQMIQQLPSYGDGEYGTDYLWASDREEIPWAFAFDLAGNHTWPLRVVAYVTEGGNDPWVEIVVTNLNANTIGSPDYFTDQLSLGDGVAWKTSNVSYFVGNYGNGIAKSYYGALTKDFSTYVTTEQVGAAEYWRWVYPNMEGVQSLGPLPLPAPGEYHFELIWYVAGEANSQDNVTSVEQAFTNQSLFKVSDFFGVDLPAFSTPTFGLAARNHGSERGMDWWYCWIYNSAESQWTDGNWMLVDFIDPNGEIYFTRELPDAHLAQGWHYIYMWSHYHQNQVFFEDDNEAWFYVQPTQSPELVITDTNSQAGGVRRDGNGNVLRMVGDDDFDRTANIDLDFGELNFSFGYPKWSFNERGNQLNLADSNPFGSFQGSQSSSFSAEWTGGNRFVDGMIELVPKDPWQIHFSTDGIQGFIGAVNFTIEQLGGGSDRFHLIGSVGGSSANVDHYNDGSQVSRKWLFDGDFGFSLDEIKGLESPAVPVPGFPLVQVWAALDVGNLNATVNLPGFGYDPSRPDPWSHPVDLDASTSFEAKLAFGRELCSYEVSIKGGGSTSVAMNGTIDPRVDGIYLSGVLEFGSIVADLELDMEGPFGCSLKTERDFVLLGSTTISLGDSNGIKIYNFE